MEKLRNTWRRVVVVAKAAPTWLVAASTAVTIASEELVKLLPDHWDEQVVRWATVATGALGAAVILIRRLTPVLPDERGILPQAAEWKYSPAGGPGRHEEIYDEFSIVGRGPTEVEGDGDITFYPAPFPGEAITRTLPQENEEPSGHDRLAGP